MPANLTVAPDAFRANLKTLIAGWPLPVHRLCHGRDPTEGLDCIGLVIWAYRECGLPIDELDVPYDISTERWVRAQNMLVRQLLGKFNEVPRAMVRTGYGFDGDLWLIGRAGDRHTAIRVGKHLWQMGDRMFSIPVAAIKDGHVRVFRLLSRST